MKTKMKKVLALFLALSLVLVSFGDFARVKAAGYTDVTLTSMLVEHSAVSGDNWILYFNTSGYSCTDWSYKYEGFTYEINGDVGTTTQVSSAGENRLYCTIPTSVLSTADGTVLKIKAGNYAAESGTDTGLNITNDFEVVVIGGHLVSPVIDAANIEAFNHSANSFYFSMKDANGTPISTGHENWNNFLSPSYYNSTRVDTADWNTVYSAVLIDGAPMDYWGAHFKNVDAGTFYVDGLSATQGTTVTIKGFFTSSTQANWTVVGSYFLKEMTFTYDGSVWTYSEPSSEPTYTEHTGTPAYHGANPNAPSAGFYFIANEQTFPYDGNWGTFINAEDDANSGVFLNGNKTSIPLKKVDPELWYMCVSDGSVTPQVGDVFTIKGSFVVGTDRITFSEAKFTWNGTAYETYVEMKNYTGTPKLLEYDNYGKAAGFYFSSQDGAPYAEDWTLTYTAVDGEANGVFVNGTKTAIDLKKTGTDTWYVCIGDAGVTLNEGDVLTIKGAFQVNSDVVTFTEASFEFTGKHFSEGEYEPTEFTITGLAYSDIIYVDNHWNMYFTLSTNIPGDVDGTYFPYMTYEIDGTEYTTHWFKSSSAHIVDGVTYYNLYFPIEHLPETFDKEYTVTVKAGTVQGRASGTNVARADGIKLTEDYQFVVGGDYEASAPAIDYTMANGGNENGIYLSSGDAFPTIGWDYNLTKVGDGDGIYVDNEATEVYIKKYTDTQYYVCLLDKGITATEGTVVMLKGAFTTAGLNKVTFKTAKYIYTDSEWKIYSVTEIIESTGTWGDATAEGGLNSRDLIRAKRYLANEADEIGLYDADLNGSGAIDTYDINMVRRLLVGDEFYKDGYNVDGVPTYEDNQEMRLAAYVSPTVAEGFTLYKEAGFTTLLGENRAKYGYDGFAEYMNAAKEAGLDVLVQTDNAQLMSEGTMEFNASTLRTDFDDLKNTYGDTFRGYFLGDEPDISQLDSYTNVMNALNSFNQEAGKDMFIAHHPIYTAEANLWTDDTLSLNEKYEKYTETFGELFDEFMYDFYPFRYKYNWKIGSYINGEDNYVNEDWFNNLEIVAQKGHGNFKTGITVQSYAENNNPKDHLRDITQADVSFQVYSALAYGMKSVTYFTYGEHWDSSVGTTSCMIYNGERTNTYYAVQTVNQEIKALDHILLNYNWQGTIGVTGDNEDTIMNHVAAYTSPRISDYSASNDAIIGCLKDLNGYDGFMLVNATDPSNAVNETVSVTFKDADHAKVYINGVEHIVELSNGTYTATLTPGQGIFVIPYIQ